MSNEKLFIVKYPPQYGVIKTKLDHNNNFKNTMFPSVYSGCWHSVENIILHNNEIADSKCSACYHSGENSFKKSDYEPFVNPIIAITGSRGSGKSSAMNSFAEYLKSLTDYKSSFSVLPPIDATQFGKNESVIGNITASMYREYSNNNRALSVDKKRDFVLLAKEVNNTAVMYSTGDWFKCGDDILQDSEKVGNLRKRLHDLIMNYLNLYCDNPANTNKYLVIMLDDLDMCSEGAFSIIEEIRKFLCMRNVIILMTMQSEQLRTVLQASYITAFGNVDNYTKPLIRNISMELAFRSYEKLFPASRCHAMPVWNSDRLREFNLFLEGEDKDGKNKRKDIYITEKDNNDNEVCSDYLYGCLPQETRSKVLYRTLHMIWRKTLMIPVCNKDGEHLLIPNNLRSLHNFIAMFSGMEDALTISKDPLPDLIPGLQGFDDFFQGNHVNKNILDKNLTIFENYLLDNLSTYGESLNHNKENQALASTLQNLILELHTVPLERLNAKIVGDIVESKLPKHIKEAFKNLKCSANAKNAKEDETYYLEKAVSYADCISIGDILYVLGKISVKTRCRYIAYLVEVIRTMWSIRMTREFYMHDPQKEPQRIVSKPFRRTVGGLIVDANATTFTNISENGDWYESRKGYEEYDKLFFAFQRKIKSSSAKENKDAREGSREKQPTGSSFASRNLIKDCLSYRNHNEKGEPYYHFSKGDTGSAVCHYLAYYTNALEPENARDEKIVYFPFYSFDFMYRFYEEFRRECRELNFDQLKLEPEDAFVKLESQRATAMDELLKTICIYIPLTASRKQINPLKKILDAFSKETPRLIKELESAREGIFGKCYAYTSVTYYMLNGLNEDRDSVEDLKEVLQILSRVKSNQQQYNEARAEGSALSEGSNQAIDTRDMAKKTFDQSLSAAIEEIKKTDYYKKKIVGATE